MIQFFKDHKQDILIGATYAGLHFFIIGWPVLVIAPFCGVSWTLSGMPGFDKYWRRIDCPGIIFITMAICLHSFKVLIGWPIAFGILCIGYGTPSLDPPDAGSALGRFWFKIFKQNKFWTNVFTRGTIYLGLFTASVIGWSLR